MDYRVIKIGTSWHAQILGLHSWIDLLDDDCKVVVFPTEQAALTEVKRRIAKFGQPRHKGKTPVRHRRIQAKDDPWPSRPNR